MAKKRKREPVHAETLASLRRRIDEIDGDIVRLLDDRARLAMRTAGLKQSMGAELYQPGREAEILSRVSSRAKVFPKSSMAAVYREIIGTSLSLERPFSVAVFGGEATYTHLAAIKHFGRNANIVFEASIPDVFRKVEKGDHGAGQSRVDVGVVPIENSTEGAIVHTLDCLVDSSLMIAAEILMPVRHHLMVRRKPNTRSNARAREGAEGARPVLKKIISHPQALAQCRNFLEAYYSGVPVCEASSTAAAALEASRHDGVAAIASELAAEKYGLHIVDAGIEDVAGNTTRFLVLRRPQADQAKSPAGKSVQRGSGSDKNDNNIEGNHGAGQARKTSIAFSMKDRPGALLTMLEPFKRRVINLTKIESRPARIKAWRYVFFIDMEGNISTPAVRSALKELEKDCQFYRFLGSYTAVV